MALSAVIRRRRRSRIEAVRQKRGAILSIRTGIGIGKGRCEYHSSGCFSLSLFLKGERRARVKDLCRAPIGFVRVAVIEYVTRDRVIAGREIKRKLIGGFVLVYWTVY